MGLALLAVFAAAHEIDESECLELVQENDRWHIVNQCEYWPGYELVSSGGRRVHLEGKRRSVGLLGKGYERR